MLDQRFGNYRLERRINDFTFHAVHTLLPRRAVIKVLDSAQLLREAVILEALHHPGIVRVYESGLLADRTAWFARELAEGPQVASMLAPGALDRVDVVRLLRDVTEVIEHAHRRGIIHCGLRPSRIVMCGQKPRGYPLCITDWSDARAHDAAPTPYITSTESWHYTSPELACGDPIDDRVDVYAIGVIAYQLLTGTLPFAQRAIAKIGDETTFVPSEVHAPDAPRELTQLVDSMIAYDMWDRPSCAEIHAQLAELVDLMTGSSTMPGSPSKHPGLVHRIRKPRWTPGYTESTPPPELVSHPSQGKPTKE